MNEDYKLMATFPPATHEIWIADDFVIHCRLKERFWQKWFIKFFFGWKIKKVKEKK